MIRQRPSPGDSQGLSSPTVTPARIAITQGKRKALIPAKSLHRTKIRRKRRKFATSTKVKSATTSSLNVIPKIFLKILERLSFLLFKKIKWWSLVVLESIIFLYRTLLRN